MKAVKGHLGSKRVDESSRLRGFKNQGGILDAEKAFGSHVAKPGTIGKKGKAK